ncbi:MAG: Crp/Fnr family transcriptional regulator [Flavobacteriaceae bacterium]|nr:Crp/Fnr family transcriptional regulator [Flavobacteriaceae bacterium]
MIHKTVFQLFHELRNPPRNWSQITDIAIRKNYKKNDIICRAGLHPENLFFIKSGVVRKYITDNSGKEYNKFLFSSNHVVVSLTAISTKKTANFNIECLTDVTLYEISYSKLRNILKNDLELSNLYTDMLHHFFVIMEESEVEKVLLEAKERYLNFQTRHPSIINKIPLFHIASYLGITPIQLSRIRSSLKKVTNF